LKAKNTADIGLTNEIFELEKLDGKFKWNLDGFGIRFLSKYDVLEIAHD